LAHVKSVESLGRTDSFAFLEVLFDKNGSSGSLGGPLQSLKRGRGSTGEGLEEMEEEEEGHISRKLRTDSGGIADEVDDDVGLCLEEEDKISPIAPLSTNTTKPSPTPPSSAYPCAEDATDLTEEAAGIQRAYQDATAVRGLLAVHKSSENLKGLTLPSKMQKSLSQEFKHKLEPPSASPNNAAFTVKTAPTTLCGICNAEMVDTQIRPCGHMFHGACIRASLKDDPVCPIDGRRLESAILAVIEQTNEEREIERESEGKRESSEGVIE